VRSGSREAEVALLGEDDQDEEIRFGSGGATLDTRHAYEEED
jgi:hypothetical protein